MKKKVYEVLKSEPHKALTSKELAQEIFERHPIDCKSKKDRSDAVTNDTELVQQIAREIGAHAHSIVQRYPSILIDEIRPRKFYISKENARHEVEIDDLQQVTNPIKITSLKEHDLYPLLGSYIHHEMNCVSMRINESRSSNSHGKGGNHWLFPDIVGMIDLSKDWHPEVTDLAESLAAKRVRLCSFEVKKAINRSNVREVVFQTVSNSSWANLAYLAAANLESKARSELSLLCLAHGIGFINIDINDPSESQILIPAKFNDKVNYDSLNRLASDNKDAEEYLENVSAFLKTKKLRKKHWNLVPDEAL